MIRFLKSLGYKKQTIKQKRVAQVEAATPSAPTESSTEAENASATPEPAVDAQPIETDTNEVEPSSDVETKPTTVEEIAEPSPQEASPVENAEAETVVSEEVEITLWRMAPKRPPNRRKTSEDKAHEGKERRQPNAKSRGKTAGPKDKRSRKPHQRREKQPDPDSPFAVLASLKSELSAPQSDKKSNATETAE